MADAFPRVPDDGLPEAGRARTNSELREEAVGRILETAIKQIAEHGASKLSLVDVGRAAGYSHSLPNYYFGTKRRLIIATYDYIIREAPGRFKEWIRSHIKSPVRPGLDNIQATIRAYLAQVYRDPNGVRAMHVLWSESLTSMPELQDTVRSWNARFVDFFAEELGNGIKRGEVDPDIDVQYTAVLMAGLIRGAVAQHLLNPESIDLERLAEAAVKLLQFGVGKGSSAQG